MEINKDILIRLLFLVESNLHTSASTSGLHLRQQNNKDMESILIDCLKVTHEDAEELYMESIG